MSAAVVSPGARTRRARSGAQAPTGRHQVGLTVPRDLKDRMLEAASVLEWSLADWVLAAAAEFGPTVPAISGLKRRQAVPDVTFCALYVTPEERAELDDQARSLDMNRSAFVTAVAQLALGASPDAVRRGLTHGEPVEIPDHAARIRQLSGAGDARVGWMRWRPGKPRRQDAFRRAAGDSC
jgi:hypothetical protein